jgi:hypothetical protein
MVGEIYHKRGEQKNWRKSGEKRRYKKYIFMIEIPNHTNTFYHGKPTKIPEPCFIFSHFPYQPNKKERKIHENEKENAIKVKKLVSL